MHDDGRDKSKVYYDEQERCYDKINTLEVICKSQKREILELREEIKKMGNQADCKQMQFKTLQIQNESTNQECNYFKKEYDYLSKLFQEMELHVSQMLGKKMPASRRQRGLTDTEREAIKEEQIMKDILKIDSTNVQLKLDNTQLVTKNKKLTEQADRLNKKLRTSLAKNAELIVVKEQKRVKYAKINAKEIDMNETQELLNGKAENEIVQEQDGVYRSEHGRFRLQIDKTKNTLIKMPGGYVTLKDFLKQIDPTENQKTIKKDAI